VVSAKLLVSKVFSKLDLGFCSDNAGTSLECKVVV
jgi:hypothetical protein